jgi:hypothetical protein
MEIKTALIADDKEHPNPYVLYIIYYELSITTYILRLTNYPLQLTP